MLSKNDIDFIKTFSNLLIFYFFDKSNEFKNSVRVKSKLTQNSSLLNPKAKHKIEVIQLLGY